MKKEEVIIKLDIYSWGGLAIGAIHYYGNLIHPCGKQSDRIKRPLSLEDAENINRRMKLTHSEKDWRFYSVDVGEMDCRFDYEEQVIETAKKIWKEIFPDGTILVDKNDTSIVYDRV